MYTESFLDPLKRLENKFETSNTFKHVPWRSIIAYKYINLHINSLIFIQIRYRLHKSINSLKFKLHIVSRATYNDMGHFNQNSTFCKVCLTWVKTVSFLISWFYESPVYYQQALVSLKHIHKGASLKGRRSKGRNSTDRKFGWQVSHVQWSNDQNSENWYKVELMRTKGVPPRGVPHVTPRGGWVCTLNSKNSRTTESKDMNL